MGGISGGSNNSSSQQNSSSRPTSPDEIAAYFTRLNDLTGGASQKVANPNFDPWQNYNYVKAGGDPNNLPSPQYITQVTTPGKLSSFALQGSQPVDYKPVTGSVTAQPVDYKPVTGSVTAQPVDYKPVTGSVTAQPVDYKPVTGSVTAQNVSYQGLTPAQVQALGGLGASQRLVAQRARDEAIKTVAADPRLSVYQSQRSNQLTNRDYADQTTAIAKEAEAAISQTVAQQAQAKMQADLANQAAGIDAGKFNLNFASDQAARKAAIDQANQAAGIDTGKFNLTFAGDQAARKAAIDQANQAAGIDTGKFNLTFAGDQAARKAAIDQANQAAGIDTGKFNLNFASDQAAKAYDALVRNSNLSRDDLLALANIFFGGKGTVSNSTGTSKSSGFNFGANVS